MVKRSQFAVILLVLFVLIPNTFAQTADTADIPVSESTSPDVETAPLAEPDPSPFAEDDEQSAAPVKKVVAKKSVWYGLRLSGRGVFLPQSTIEWFVERASSGVSELGYGVELYRRTNEFELALGLGFDGLSPDDGIWIEKGQSIPVDQPDLVEFEDFSWFSVDLKITWRTELGDMLALRYGVGLGLGIMLGDIYRSDFICANESPSSCGQLPGGKVREKEDGIPPVLPILHANVGLEIRPVPNFHVIIEGGLRTIPFLGASVGYEF